MSSQIKLVKSVTSNYSCVEREVGILVIDKVEHIFCFKYILSPQFMLKKAFQFISSC
jgi:hypothetical protein